MTVFVALLRKKRYRFLKVLIPACLLLLLIILLVSSLRHGEKEEEIAESPAPIESTQPLLVTSSQMASLSYTDSVLGEMSWSLSGESLLELNQVLLDYDICDPEEISLFLAQATIETGAGKMLTEQGDEEYFQSKGYSTGTRGAGYLHITYEYGQMAFSTWMMKKYIPELSGIEYKNPAHNNEDEIAAAYYAALQTAANLGLDVSLYSRIVYDPNSTMTTGADYIAEAFAWESAGYYWHIAGIGESLSSTPEMDNVDIVSERVGGSHWQSRREAYAAFYPILSNQPSQ